MATKAEQVLSRELDLYNEFWAIARPDGRPIPQPEPRFRFVVLENTPGYLDDLIEAGIIYNLNADPEHNFYEVTGTGIPVRHFYINHEGPCF